MKTELKGEGTFDYECHDPDCFYCQRMNEGRGRVVNGYYIHIKDAATELTVDMYPVLSPYQRRKQREAFGIRKKVAFMKYDKTY